MHSYLRINSATAAELRSLSGVGPQYADAILAWRDQNGALSGVNDLIAAGLTATSAATVAGQVSFAMDGSEAQDTTPVIASCDYGERSTLPIDITSLLKWPAGALSILVVALATQRVSSSLATIAIAAAVAAWVAYLIFKVHLARAGAEVTARVAASGFMVSLALVLAGLGRGWDKFRVNFSPFNVEFGSTDYGLVSFGVLLSGLLLAFTLIRYMSSDWSRFAGILMLLGTLLGTVVFINSTTHEWQKHTHVDREMEQKRSDKSDHSSSSSHGVIARLEKLSFHVRAPAGLQTEFPLFEGGRPRRNAIPTALVEGSDVRLIGKFSEPVHWELFLFDEVGAVSRLSASRGAETELDFPRDTGATLQGRGVQLMLILGAVNAWATESHSKVFDGIGRPPQSLPEVRGARLRGITIGGSGPLEIPDDYLKLIGKRIPEAVGFAFGFYIDVR